MISMSYNELPFFCGQVTISGELEARGIPTSLRQAAEDFAKAPRSHGRPWEGSVTVEGYQVCGCQEMTIKYISLGTLKSSIFVDGFSMKPSIGEGYVVCMYIYIYIYMYIYMYLGKL